MAQARSNGITLAYEISGPEDGAPILLIHGVGAQLVRWPPEFVGGLAEAGFRVIRFDNRDVGLSTHMHDAGVPDFAAVVAAKARGATPDLPYDLDDLAADAIGLLDAIGVARAHVIGVSLGGMIAQMMAIDHPQRVASLTIMMSQSGNADLPPSDPAAMAKLTEAAPDPAVDREGYLRHSVSLNRVLGSPAYPTDEAALRTFAALSADRAYDPAGAARQLAAGRSAPDRRARLRTVAHPTLVIHGADDLLILPAAGDDLAATIPGAWLLRIAGMGHDIPAQLCNLFVGAITANAARADQCAPAIEVSQ